MSETEEREFKKLAAQSTPNLLFQLIAEQNEKLDQLAAQFGGIHADQHRYIESLIAREEKRAKFRDAVIEKTLASLVWSGVVAIAIACWSYVKDHLK